MTNDKLKKLLDFIPFIILLISALILMWTRFNSDIRLQWKHTIGLVLLLINCFLFWRLHKLGVIGLGATLILGLVGLISYSPAITISKVFWTPFDTQIPIFYGQPIFLLWLIIHFILSGRHYVAIATKKYWQDLVHNLKAQ